MHQLFTPKLIKNVSRNILFVIPVVVLLSACVMHVPTDLASPQSKTPHGFESDDPIGLTCPATEPEWAKPPEDAAVQGPSDYGYYYINQDRSIWASAWWTGQEEEFAPRAGEEGIKVGWFRPEGVPLAISGKRLDGDAPPLAAHAPCCYPTRFQASGLVFPSEGCWEVTAQADDRTLSFVVRVTP